MTKQLPMLGGLEHLDSWGADWGGLRVVVAGIGASGFAAADTLVELGAKVAVVDGVDNEYNRERKQTLEIVGAVSVELGTEHVEAMPAVDGEQPDLVIVSPGWRPSHPLLVQAREAGVPVWSEIELAWRVRDGRELAEPAEWLCVTGTNGKTTTVTMAAEMLRQDGFRAIAVGNVGTPVLDAIRDPQGYDVLVVELSSFQLHHTYSISPLASTVLNIAEDHVDWHGGFEQYKADKAKIYERTKIAAIFNAEDPVTLAMVEEADVVEGCRGIGFTTQSPAVSMLGVVEDLLVDRAYIAERRTQAQELAQLSDLGPRPAHHTVANALAAAALTRAAGINAEGVAAGLRAYDRGEHRIQTIAEADGVTWIDDSKATNPHAAHAALAAYPSVVWVAGGLAKGVEYHELVQQHSHHLRAVVLIGTDTSALEEALTQHAPNVPVLRTQVGETGKPNKVTPELGEAVMKQAVSHALSVAQEGDTVLLAPASASMDQFASYAARGHAFAKAVAEALGKSPE
ncbi:MULTISPECIES: UDP-N-acetylmuramoyl-L-alanine--D-glutamate ligase [Micrococcaceae]|uniref:UDP-N-acetylmuramoylalanine--D-glutamate ligase n=2 Tax=Micrococcaceae TaxID=1268 RepID=A0ABU1YZR1_9MICC|nr:MULTISPECIES: UDP-N-acetylmuramoyl-L-alanine--D-glutamate ligase [Micrococcaceae]MDR7293840.1 UDP-N-acetylmuramoylalanine--D-glutamate ligase [Pseudoglutamicibacter albus]